MEKICLSAVVRLCSDIPSPSLAGAASFSVSVPVEPPSEGAPGVVGPPELSPSPLPGSVGPPELSPLPLLSSLPGSVGVVGVVGSVVVVPALLVSVTLTILLLADALLKLDTSTSARDTLLMDTLLSNSGTVSFRVLSCGTSFFAVSSTAVLI